MADFLPLVIPRMADIMPAVHVSKDVPFEPEPQRQLQLYLKNISLHELPRQLFDLRHLTVLTLRNNFLREIPPAISQLTNLVELNLSSNELTYLPVELLELICAHDSKMRRLNLHPNPFHGPLEVQVHENLYSLPQAHWGRRWLTKPASSVGFHACLAMRTPVEFLDLHPIDRMRFPFRISADRQDEIMDTEELDAVPVLPCRARPTKVRSLTELCLQTVPLKYPANTDWAAHVKDLNMFQNSLVSPANSAFVEMLKDMDARCEAGIKVCTVCRKKVIRPVAQWIEWYELYVLPEHKTAAVAQRPITETVFDADAVVMEESLPLLPDTWVPVSTHLDTQYVPFLRQACTWGCVADPARGLGRQQDPS